MKENSHAFDATRKIGNIAGSVVAGMALSAGIGSVVSSGGVVASTSTELAVVENFGDDVLAVTGKAVTNLVDDAVSVTSKVANSADDVIGITGPTIADDVASATSKVAEETVKKFNSVDEIVSAIKKGEIPSKSEARKIVKDFCGGGVGKDGGEFHQLWAQIVGYYK